MPKPESSTLPAIALLKEDPELSLLLARESARLSPGPTAEDALLESLVNSRVLATYQLGLPLPAVAIATQPALVAYVDDSGKLVVIHVDDARSDRLAEVAPGSRVVLSGDGTYAVAVDPKTEPRILDGKTGDERCALSGLGGAAADAVPAGGHVVVVRNGIGTIWRVSDCKLVRPVGRRRQTAVRIVVYRNGTRGHFCLGVRRGLSPIPAAVCVPTVIRGDHRPRVESGQREGRHRRPRSPRPDLERRERAAVEGACGATRGQVLDVAFFTARHRGGRSQHGRHRAHLGCGDRPVGGPALRPHRLRPHVDFSPDGLWSPRQATTGPHGLGL